MKVLGFFSFSLLIAFGICQEIVYQCPENFTLNEDTKECYNFQNQVCLSWDDASESCRSMSSHLLKIDNEAENDYAQEQMHPTCVYWFGLNDKATEGNFEFIDREAENVTFDRWAPFQPSNLEFWAFGRKEDCARVIFGFWDDSNCDAKYPYVCEAQSEKEVICPETWTSNEGDVENINACYKAMNTRKTHAEAKTSCEDEGGFLFYPTTEAEGDFANSLAPSNKYWIDVGKEDGAWMHNSMELTPEQQNWFDNQPSNNANRLCVAARKNDDAKWSNHNCGGTKKYICKRI